MSNPNLTPAGRLGHNPIVIDDDDDDDDGNGTSSDETTTDDEMQLEYYGQQGQHLAQQGMRSRYQPHQTPFQPRHPRPSIPTYTTSTNPEHEKKIRSRLREERHAALCVLMDRELLTVLALAAQETLPQTRRRFLAKLMAPEDPETAASIRADHFTIQPHQPSSHHSLSSTVQRRVVDVHETDDTGWRRPVPFSASATTAAAAAAAAASPRSSSMSSSSAATTPAGGTTGSMYGMGVVGSGTRSGSRSPALMSSSSTAAVAAAATEASRTQRGRMSPLTTASTSTSGMGTGSRGRTSGTATASRSQQHRERERRRRWSGAEREDGMGGSFGGFLS